MFVEHKRINLIFLLCVQYLMNGTIDLHWNNKVSIANRL